MENRWFKWWECRAGSRHGYDSSIGGVQVLGPQTWLQLACVGIDLVLFLAGDGPKYVLKEQTNKCKEVTQEDLLGPYLCQFTFPSHASTRNQQLEAQGFPCLAEFSREVCIPRAVHTHCPRDFFAGLGGYRVGKSTARCVYFDTPILHLHQGSLPVAQSRMRDLQDLACRLKEKGQHLASCLCGMETGGQTRSYNPQKTQARTIHLVYSLWVSFPSKKGYATIFPELLPEPEWVTLVSLMVVMFLL